MATRRAADSDGKTRVDWVDSIRGVGIFLVFYGHLLQKGFLPGNAAVAEQFRFIYSFHMPLFFVLAGFFFKPARDNWDRLWRLAPRRLVPVLVFGLVLVPPWLHHELKDQLPLWPDALKVVAEYAGGRPELNWVTWFLICLFVCEAMALICLRKITGATQQLLFGLACVVGGVWLCNTCSTGLAYGIAHTWFLAEAVVALGFYSIGHAVYPWARRLGEQRALAAVLFFVFTGVVLATFHLNPRAGEAVMMGARRQGAPLPFVVTALAGTVASIALGVLLGRVRWLHLLGRNTLPLLGLNGFFFHYLDPKLPLLWKISDSPGSVFFGATLVTLLSLLACAPLVYLLNRHLPQLIGKSSAAGPWLPALEPRPNR